MSKTRFVWYFLSLTLFSLLKFAGWTLAFVVIVVGGDSHTATRSAQLAALFLAVLSTGLLLTACCRLYSLNLASMALAGGFFFLLKTTPLLFVAYLGLNVLVWGWLWLDLRKRRRQTLPPTFDSVEEWAAYQVKDLPGLDLAGSSSARYLLNAPDGNTNIGRAL